MKGNTEDVDPVRRSLLVKMLAAGAFTTGWARKAMTEALGKTPGMLPQGKSIYSLDGRVLVNNQPATPDTLITATDTIETAEESRIIFVVGQDAFILRERSRLELGSAGGRLVINTLRVLSGKLLSVFGKSEHTVHAVTATIGIRGTGLYVESEPDQSYVCTCYGTTELQAIDDPSQHETIQSHHHDAPRYILASGAAGARIRPAPFKNHTDQELELIEALVGRVPPFVLPGDSYATPRRTEY
ncbi:MAG TPA: hypothetical protein VMH34_06865 [Gammaproteobacteria bacterium]|nr:hypothetical protein [Gammaproteobacteria bacterium]